MSVELFIAKRIYSQDEGKRHVSRPAVRIALSGIILGLAVMIVSIAVVMGFKDEVSKKVIGFGSDIQVISLTQNQDRVLMPVLTTDSLLKVVSAIPHVVHVQRYATTMGMLKTADDFRGLQFKGVGEDYDRTFFQTYLKDGRMPVLSSDSASNELLLSRRVASDLGLNVGDKVYAYFVGGTGMRARRFCVTGIYETNLTEYDRNIVLTDIYTIRKLNNWDSDMSTGLEVTVSDFGQVDELTHKLGETINRVPDRYGCIYGVFSIKQLAPNIFSWLGVLDMNVVMILILMICVASFTVMSGMLIIMLERINMIGILKALGATNASIRRIFINFSVMLVGRGVLWGNVVGFGLCLLQYLFHVVKLDSSVYYLESVPIRFDWVSIVGVNAVTLLISLAVILGSSYFMGLGKPAQTMKYE